MTNITDLVVATYQEDGEASEEADEPEQVVDLGWEEPQEIKRKKPTRPPPTTSAVDEDEARVGHPSRIGVACSSSQQYRLELLTSLSAHLARIRLLRQAESKLAATKGLMGKGAARKVRDQGYVEDETQPENRNGDRQKWQEKIWKWKLERRR